MSLSGSWPRRYPRWFTSRSATPDAPAPKGRARALTVRRVTRDFALWETEIGRTTTTTDEVSLTTVIGHQVVEVSIGHRPIQEVAVHLRRLRLAIDALPDDVSFVRWEGVMRAYDDYLFAACRELDVPTDLVTINFGRQRDEERCRLERQLHKAGLPVR